jgi:RNA polymerase sigma factor (sigma-70 family)
MWDRAVGVAGPRPDVENSPQDEDDAGGSEAKSDPKHSRWFEEQVSAHDAPLKSYLRGKFPSVRDVDDVVQESYLRVWKARLRRPIRSAKSFLFQVARNLAIDQLRHRKAAPIIEVPDPAALPVMDDRPGVAETACTHEELALLARAIDSLPARCRTVMILRQIEGIPQKEIAASLGLSELTVQTHVVHGLRRIEKFMRSRGALRPET